MTARDVVAEHLPDVQGFLTRLMDIDDDEDRHAELRRISRLIRFLRAFYTVFLRETLNVHIQGFSYKDKRVVSRRLVRAEDEAIEAVDDDHRRATLELAARFEDLSDLLHGELEFGYSDEDDDYEVFHRDTFPGWLEAVELWLRATESAEGRELPDAVHEAWSDYSDAIASAY